MLGGSNVKWYNDTITIKEVSMELNDSLIMFLLAGIILLIIIIWIFKNNHALRLTTYQIKNDKLPESFDQYRIIHLSDIHNIDYGDNNKIIMNQVIKGNPDCIVITGDLVDSRKTIPSISLKLILELIKISPVYYVTGNHESRLKIYDQFEMELRQVGVIVLRDEAILLKKNKQVIQIIGIDDPNFDRSKDRKIVPTVIVDNKLQKLKKDNLFTLLLIHRPELFDVYVKNGIDIALTGHTHGGQIRIPFIGGIIAPSQGFFPKYDAGLFQKSGTNMIISRGIGDSSFPFRINDNPEVVLIVLNK